MISPSFIDPANLDTSSFRVKIEKWKVKYNTLQNMEKQWIDVVPWAYQLMLVHCHPKREQKLMALEKFSKINQDQDPVELLKLIKSIALKNEDEKGLQWQE